MTQRISMIQRIRLAGVFALAVAFASASPAHGQSTGEQSTGGQPIYEKLAKIEDQGSPAEKTVKRFRSLVPILAGKYPTEEQAVGRITMEIRDRMENKGLSMSLLGVMEGINRVTPTDGTEKPYLAIIDWYSHLRVYRSYSHSEAVSALKEEF